MPFLFDFKIHAKKAEMQKKAKMQKNMQRNAEPTSKITKKTKMQKRQTKIYL